MYDDTANPAVLRPEELEAVYAISRAVARTMDIETALDEIIRLARSVFIFDNMVLYQPGKGENLEPAYARAIGRGRSQEADLVWGETTAQEALQSGQVIIRREQMGNYQEDRLHLRYSLGLPLHSGEEVLGALVFIRFGGPSFKPDQIRLSEFIAEHVAQLLGYKTLVRRIANLEAERRLDRLQEDFIATVSHELLTPLGFIKGYATTLLREDTTWDDDTRHEFLSIIDEEADRLRELIENLMDSSRLQAGTLRMDFQPVRLDAFLKDMQSRARAQKANLDITLEINEVGYQIQADPTRLAQVFDNLLSNAIKYAPGSPVRIGLERTPQQAHIIFEDHGPGIPREYQENLFKRFYRVPTNNVSVHGTGLGLFICRRIIQAHGGDIRVESHAGKGTIFHLYLPHERQAAEDSISLRESNV